MNYHGISIYPDTENSNLTGADEILTGLDEVAEQIRPNTYVVVATHGNYDELALVNVLKASPTYVGLVASQKRAQAVQKYLKLQGISDSEMLQLKAPAGLDIQAWRGDEIALSIMAEIVQRKCNTELMDTTFSKRDSGK